ncbi:MAG: DUF1292 domain-containing protein [Oscillospiraceae bacterium]|nr:DUF1292 domain-containing protein [Oscillospiraceae bacterium]
MDGGFGNDFITVQDDDGNELELEHLDSIEHGGEFYMAFLPADMDEDDEDYGIVILKVVVMDNEETLITVDDEDELSAVYTHFLERLSDAEES